MTAQLTATPVQGNKPAVKWGSIRIAVGLVYLITQTTVVATARVTPQASAILETLTFVSLGLFAAFLSLQSAKSFSRGQTARRAWMFIAIMPLADAVAYAAYTMGDVLGTRVKSGIFVGVATALLSLTRILAAVAFFSMVRVYRKSGLRLKLNRRDFVGMLLISVMEVLALLFASSGARASGGADLERIVFVTAIPLVLALAPCSVLGVMIWRYTSEMGGGLIARAWRCNLLYGATWLAYIVFNAMAARYLPGSNIPAFGHFLISHGTDWTLKASEFLIFLGASYQYEASHATVDYSALGSLS